MSVLREVDTGGEMASLKAALAMRERELAEALDREATTSGILHVIAASPTDRQPVLRSVAESAAKLCEAYDAVVLLREGDVLKLGSHYGPIEYDVDKWPIGRGWVTGRCVVDRKTLHVDDIAAAAKEYPEGAAVAARFGHRTMLATPLLRKGEAIGALMIRRREMRPFSERQIDLLRTFADQAVIAIENARLFEAEQQRSAELSESLEQQTATAEVLSVISSSPGDLEPVFETILVHAQAAELADLNRGLEQRVAEQLGEIERMGRLRRFLPPQVADLIVSSGLESQLESHRREIAALFCDLRGFTGFSESSDPEDVMALLREYHDAIGTIIHKHGGTLERYAGDGVMVIFNDPVPQPNPALQAVQMALEMRAALAALMNKWRRLGHEIGFGIGISHGYATLGTIGFEGRFDYAAIGTVSNVASRLCDEANSGQILISPRVHMAIENVVTVEPAGEFALKGIRRPMPVFNVVDLATPAN